MKLSAAVRGKCRYCSASVAQAHFGWADEAGGADPYECLSAPAVQCPPCAGEGRVRDERESLRLGREVFDRCGPCRGRGFVPGPHWPWRHPPTAL